MKLLALKVSVVENNSIPKDKNLKDILGTELDQYYDGWGHNKQTETDDIFFINVPENLIDDLTEKLKNHNGITIQTKEMEELINFVQNNIKNNINRLKSEQAVANNQLTSYQNNNQPTSNQTPNQFNQVPAVTNQNNQVINSNYKVTKK